MELKDVYLLMDEFIGSNMWTHFVNFCEQSGYEVSEEELIQLREQVEESMELIAE